MTTFFRRSMIVTATAGALAGGSVLQAAAETAGPQVDILGKADIAAEIAASPELTAHKPIEPGDWAALDWHPAADPAFLSARPRVTVPAPQSAQTTQWSRTDNSDGTTAITVKRALPVSWESKVGADLSLAPPPPAVPDLVAAASLPGAARTESAGSAWASVSTPPLDGPLGVDKATLETRVDPSRDLGRVGVSASKSVALGRRLSLTLKSGYAATETFAPAPAPSGSAAARIYSSEQTAQITIVPTRTKLSAGCTTSTLDQRWLRTVSAEQELFKGASVVGSVSETTLGPLNTTILAKLQRHW